MYRMMIVDDEERIANSIYDLMDERFDFELYRCYSAMAALDVIRTMRFDIVITDIAMPGMSGLELLNKVQAIWPKCHFLILTAYDSFDYAYETLRHDRVDYLLKIESYDTICQCVERKLQDIQKERSREEKLRHYDQYRAAGGRIHGALLPQAHYCAGDPAAGSARSGSVLRAPSAGAACDAGVPCPERPESCHQ